MLYRVAVVGPTGVGKSQFCNFCLKDKTNSVYVVSASLNSCTSVPFSEQFERNKKKLELIDSAGSNDTDGKDIEHLKEFVKYLKTKNELHYILLLLRYGDRLVDTTRKFVETLANIFTPIEFFTHLAVVFTRSPIKLSKTEKMKRESYAKEIGIELDKIFKIDELDDKIKNEIPENKSFFIDTDLYEIEGNEDEVEFDKKSQETADVIFNWIEYNYKHYNLPPINTKDLDYNEETIKLRRDKELEKLKENINLLEKNIEKEKEAKKKLDKENKEKEKELKKAQEENEEQKKKNEELQNKCENAEKENNEMSIKLEEEKQKTGDLEKKNKEQDKKIRESEKAREEMERQLKSVNAQNINERKGGCLFGKIFFGTLSGLCFLAAPFTFGVSILHGIGYATVASEMWWLIYQNIISPIIILN